MVIRMVLNLSADERNALVELAQKQLRSPQDQVRIILRQVLFSRGLLTTDETSTNHTAHITEARSSELGLPKILVGSKEDESLA